MGDDVILDLGRERRIGLPEAIFCERKSAAQLAAIVEAAPARLLLTRLSPEQHAALPAVLDYDPVSRTAFLGDCPEPAGPARVAIVTAGSSDLPVAAEAQRSLRFHGLAAERFVDVGVAGLWRLLERRDRLAEFPVVIAVAGMEGALFSVLGGLIGGVLIAVPCATGYGVAAGGHAALTSALASCAPGVVAVNIDNGYGAACAAVRMLRARE
ncbi:MAG TPA: nickel pincer cofactor biosynthesis protein LarB [Geminicoccaceae bacterium]|nr:nickel pincer cofactor biosynthesis protein LarB [Geminicoccus sp.]HMU50987.1 nickel pincer cofactor biosynthesis protein LarB [Geminicoccaceae bacterium]